MSEKIDMSLDDIIKLDKKRKQITTKGRLNVKQFRARIGKNQVKGGGGVGVSPLNRTSNNTRRGQGGANRARGVLPNRGAKSQIQRARQAVQNAQRQPQRRQQRQKQQQQHQQHQKQQLRQQHQQHQKQQRQQRQNVINQRRGQVISSNQKQQKKLDRNFKMAGNLVSDKMFAQQSSRRRWKKQQIGSDGIMTVSLKNDNKASNDVEVLVGRSAGRSRLQRQKSLGLPGKSVAMPAQQIKPRKQRLRKKNNAESSILMVTSPVQTASFQYPIREPHVTVQSSQGQRGKRKGRRGRGQVKYQQGHIQNPQGRIQIPQGLIQSPQSHIQNQQGHIQGQQGQSKNRRIRGQNQQRQRGQRQEGQGRAQYQQGDGFHVQPAETALQHQLKTLKPTVHHDYNFNRSDFGKASTSMTLNDRFRTVLFQPTPDQGQGKQESRLVFM